MQRTSESSVGSKPNLRATCVENCWKAMKCQYKAQIIPKQLWLQSIYSYIFQPLLTLPARTFRSIALSSIWWDTSIWTIVTTPLLCIYVFADTCWNISKLDEQHTCGEESKGESHVDVVTLLVGLSAVPVTASAMDGIGWSRRLKHFQSTPTRIARNLVVCAS